MPGIVFTEYASSYMFVLCNFRYQQDKSTKYDFNF